MDDINNKKSFLGGLLVGFMCTSLVLGTFYVAIEWPAIRLQLAGSQSTEVLSSETVSKIQTLENTINNHYYKKDISVSDEADGIYKGLVSSLDKYSQYFTADEMSEKSKKNEGIYYGIGVSITIDEETSMPIVVAITPNSPSEKAGLKENDIIVSIDGESTKEMTMDDIAGKVKGEENTTVDLKIRRDGSEGDLDFTVERAKYDNETVGEGVIEGEDIGYISIDTFEQVTTNQFIDSYNDLKQKNVKGLILDLRGNLGGDVDVVCDIARQLLPEGVIVYTMDRDGKREDYNCDGKNEIDIPIAVLVDKNTASASEILAGAIRDYGVGTLVGTTTYGKGVVQSLITLTDGSAIKLTTSTYYTPKGVCVEGSGLKPDVEIEFDADAYYEDSSDNQLDKAVDVLKEKIK